MRSGAVGRPGLHGRDAVVHVAREYESENDHAKAIPTLVEVEIGVIHLHLRLMPLETTDVIHGVHSKTTPVVREQ